MSSDVELASYRLEGNDGFESRGADIRLKMLELIMSRAEFSVESKDESRRTQRVRNDV